MALSADIELESLLRQLEQVLTTAPTVPDLYKAVVDAPFVHAKEMAYLFLGFISFFLASVKKPSLRLVGVSDTEYYRMSVADYKFDPGRYEIGLDHPENSLVEAVRGGKPIKTANWDSLRRPKVADGVARLNQASAGIGYSMAYPLPGDHPGVLLYSFFESESELGEQQQVFMERYDSLVAAALGRLLESVTG